MTPDDIKAPGAGQAESVTLPERCSLCQVRHRAFCNVVDDERLCELAAISFHKDFEPTELIVQEERSVRQVANLIDGTVKLFKLLPDGRQQVTGFLFPGDFLGPMLSGEHNTFAEAVTPIRLCIFDRSRLTDKMDRWPDLERWLFQNASDTLDRALEWMVLLGRKSASERVATFLMMLADRAGIRMESGVRVPVAMSRTDIADFLGLTMETVSRQLSKLKKDGVIMALDPHSFLLLDLNALRQLANGDADEMVAAVG